MDSRTAVVMVDDRHSFLVVEESLPTETIADYRRSRTAGARAGEPGLRGRMVAWLSRPWRPGGEVAEPSPSDRPVRLLGGATVGRWPRIASTSPTSPAR